MDINLLDSGPNWADVVTAVTSIAGIAIGIFGTFFLIRTFREQQRTTKEQEKLTKEQELIKEDNRTDIRLRNLPYFVFSTPRSGEIMIGEPKDRADYYFNMVLDKNSCGFFEIIYYQNNSFQINARGFDNGLMLVEKSVINFNMTIRVPIDGKDLLPLAKNGKFTLHFVDIYDNEYEQNCFVTPRSITQEKAKYLGKFNNE
ncbi:hypothetical protein EZ428_15515 [Pedobacter frigiditerrae]|uniref:Uncharacterized protein n=1 Tax=Pedobacter frigiditerrae TaxID=2530452 RepID=A0A4R0MQH6_9SPHI|nr:hypothetical protein [Pedobacter frigiditerrae]TCC89108.1 hypothetical protein EZ428_15515 [Pedobacter frigiditerrae]